jgi:hypothetical protein
LLSFIANALNMSEFVSDLWHWVSHFKA